MMKRMAFATLVAMGVAAGAAAQQSSQRPSTPAPRGEDRTDQVSFDQADKNKDGEVNREEGNSIAGFDFSRADANHDLTLSRQEFESAMANSTARGDGAQGPRSGDRTEQVTFEQADKNQDNQIDRIEAEDLDGFNFSSADVDDNASLSRQEFQTAMSKSTPR